MINYMNTLMEMSLFHGIKEDDLTKLLDCIGHNINTYQKGDYIIREGEDVNYIGIILDGSVDMIKEDVWGNRTKILEMGKNEIFGETFACSYQISSTISIRSTSNTTILSMPFYRVMHICSMTCRFHHRLIENMVNLISVKNQEILRKLEIISKKTLREKIMAFLSLQSQIQECNYFEVSMGRVEMAEYLCADRSALSRELSKMKAEGIIDFDRNTFRLL